jgi:hypothetical protein
MNTTVERSCGTWALGWPKVSFSTQSYRSYPHLYLCQRLKISKSISRVNNLFMDKKIKLKSSLQNMRKMMGKRFYCSFACNNNKCIFLDPPLIPCLIELENMYLNKIQRFMCHKKA